MALFNFILNFRTDGVKTLDHLQIPLSCACEIAGWIFHEDVNLAGVLYQDRSPSQSMVLKVLCKKWSSSTF